MLYIALIVVALIRYGFVLTKYIKTGILYKKKYKSNIIGIIAYTCLILLIISFLLLLFMISIGNEENDILMAIIFFFAIMVIVAYPTFIFMRINNNTRSINVDFTNEILNKQDEKYGYNEENDSIEYASFRLLNDDDFNEQFNELVQLITNEDISFIHKDSYKDKVEVMNYLYKNDYIRIIDYQDSIYVTCENINVMLNKLNIKCKIDSKDILKLDNDYMKLRREDLKSTIVNDLNVINSMLNEEGYSIELLYWCDENNIRIAPIFVAIAKNDLIREHLNKWYRKIEDDNGGENNE